MSPAGKKPRSHRSAKKPFASFPPFPFLYLTAQAWHLPDRQSRTPSGALTNQDGRIGRVDARHMACSGNPDVSAVDLRQKTRTLHTASATQFIAAKLSTTVRLLTLMKPMPG